MDKKQDIQLNYVLDFIKQYFEKGEVTNIDVSIKTRTLDDNLAERETHKLNLSLNEPGLAFPELEYSNFEG